MSNSIERFTATRIWLLTAAASGVLFAAGCGGGTGDSGNDATSAAAEEAITHRIMEGYPVRVARSLQKRDADLASAAKRANRGPASVVTRHKRWEAGSTITVAFRGGTPELYARIEQAALAWTGPGAANLRLSFRGADGQYLKWAPGDQAHAADIRIAFASDAENGGYWSLVGTDSRNSAIDGGGAGQASMNLDSFDTALPGDWRSTVLHEFGHALGFQHEHQSPRGGCDFRFEDDPGYIPTKDAQGWFIQDAQGRRPGLYTYLGGHANNWSRERVDFNLRALPNSSAYEASAFDRSSIMLYAFDSFMFQRGRNSACWVPREATALSTQDRAGAAGAYSAERGAMAAIRRASEADTAALRNLSNLSPQLRESLEERAEYLKD